MRNVSREAVTQYIPRHSVEDIQDRRKVGETGGLLHRATGAVEPEGLRLEGPPAVEFEDTVEHRIGNEHVTCGRCRSQPPGGEGTCSGG